MSVQFTKLDPALSSTPSSPQQQQQHQHFRSDLSAALASLQTTSHNVITGETSTCTVQESPLAEDEVIGPSIVDHGDETISSSRDDDRGLLNSRLRGYRDSKRYSIVALASYDAAGVITPALLAKYHLPGVLINRGPLSVRHITACLNTSVPGFSAIPIARQRRLIVTALEGQTGARIGASSKVGDVAFEKIGWGRWAARIIAQPPTSNASSIDISHPIRRSKHSLVKGVMMDGSKYDGHDHLLRSPDFESSVGSWSNECGIFLQDEDMDALRRGERNGKSRLPSFALTSDSEDPNQQFVGTPLYSDVDDMTDEEDWETMGVEGLRGSSSISPITPGFFQGKSPSTYGQLLQPQNHSTTIREKEEQAAIEALVRLGGSF